MRGNRPSPVGAPARSFCIDAVVNVMLLAGRKKRACSIPIHDIKQAAESAGTQDKDRLRRILVADDDPFVREIITLALETLGGFTVRSLSSGAGLVNAARDFDPQLVVLDVEMPDVDGPAALRALRGHGEFDGLAVIFLTATTRADAIASLNAMAPTGIIAKPVEPTTLVEQINTIFDGMRQDQVDIS